MTKAIKKGSSNVAFRLVFDRMSAVCFDTLDVEELIRPEFLVCVPWLLSFCLHIWAIEKSTSIENAAWESADIRVHTILYAVSMTKLIGAIYKKT